MKSKKKNHPLREKGRKPGVSSVLRGLPLDRSSLTVACLLTQRVSRLGFDWPNVDGILSKLDEEISELKEALSLRHSKGVREEIGDLLFVLVNLSRFLHVDPERALRKTNRKFISRFRYVEKALQRRGRTLLQSDLQEMDRLWDEAKERNERGRGKDRQKRRGG